MKPPFLFLFLAAAALTAGAQSISLPGEMAQGVPPPPSPADDSSTAPPATAPSTARPGHAPAVTLEAMEQLTRSNQELLDLLKQQQAVLEDIQYDRRLQNRQITLLEQRLEDTLQRNATLEAKAAKLEAEARTAATAPPAADSNAESAGIGPTKPDNSSGPPTVTQPPPPVSFLPPEQTDGTPGTMWWHRLASLSGEDSKNSDGFHISGKQWRVLWHNQDRPGDSYKNTSALFISAFPKNDTLPKKICSQLGTGGDTTELSGSGDYYLKIEASGGKWELAIEDFR